LQSTKTRRYRLTVFGADMAIVQLIESTLKVGISTPKGLFWNGDAAAGDR